jgi:hypothetical protein
MPLADLAAPPAAVADAAALIDRLDQAFSGGFARLAEEHLGALEALQHAFAGTPLSGAVQAAVEGIGRSEFLDKHFLALAAARAALQGAQHDALIAQASAALGRPAPKLATIGAAAGQAPPPQHTVWLESARHWLMELGLAGFSNLGTDTLLPFQATLDLIESDGRLPRHATLLGGFLDEMLSVFPAQVTPAIPIFRWADLWSRAMVLSAVAPAAAPTRAVKGELRLLGADLRQHDTFASIVTFGVLREPDQKPRLVRATVSAFKVDVIQGEELGPLLCDAGVRLLDALSNGKALSIDGMALTATNDLIWQDDKAKVGAAFDVMAEAADVLGAASSTMGPQAAPNPGASGAPADRPCLEPADRHPALIEELVYLTGYDVAGKDEMTLAIGGAALPIAHDRWPDTPDLAPSDLKGSAGLVGLLRFDGGRWSLQPIAVKTKKPPIRGIGASFGGSKGKKSKMEALSTLKERASKLLRKR